ncbi:MAG: serine/threonine protein kinase [Gammaproteobacteria bacterium]
MISKPHPGSASESQPGSESGSGPDSELISEEGIAEEAGVPYAGLSPEIVLDAVEAAGFRSDGRQLALNSYENRVYQVGVEDARPVVVKFYRPGRWSDEAILEEHAFSLELADAEIPVVAPLRIHGKSLLRHHDYRYAVFASCGGRWPELGTREDRIMVGRFLGRIHLVGSRAGFEHRQDIDPARLGGESCDWLLEQGWLPSHLEEAYDSLTVSLMEAVYARFDNAGAYRELRIHGDCHPGNILWTDSGPHFVDLDDCVTGPAVQDLWMLLSGEADEMRLQLGQILEGYAAFSNFDPRELWLIEALRTLRIIHYSAWLARRWQDPAFPRAFPWFGEARFWEEHILALREQASALQEAPLQP